MQSDVILLSTSSLTRKLRRHTQSFWHRMTYACGAVPSMAGLMVDYKVFKMPSTTLSAFINVKMLVSEDNVSVKLVY